MSPDQNKETKPNSGGGDAETQPTASFAAPTVIGPNETGKVTLDQPIVIAKEAGEEGEPKPTTISSSSNLESAPLAINGGQILPAAAYPPKTASPKKKLLIGATLLALFAGVGGYIFGFYLPNQPENVWQSGLNNSGDALNKVVNDLTAKDRLEQLKKTEIAISAEVNGAGYDFSGTANSKLDGDKSVSNAKITSSEKSSQKINLNLDVLAEVPEGKIYPEIYFKLAGLKSFGDESLFASFNKYDDKWISISSTYLESLYEQSDKPKEKPEAVNSGDVAEFVKTISETSNEYVFSSNKDKAVLINKGFKGKETVDGVDTFRYEVGVDKNHAKDYCKALSNRLLDLALTKKLSSGDSEALKQEKESVDKDCSQSVDEAIKDDEILEAWVNTKYKIIHKIRKYNGKDKTIYTEVGQIYKGGKDLSLFLAYHEDGEKVDVKLVMDVDTKTLASKGTFTASKKTDDSYDVMATVEVKPYKGEVKVDKPSGAIDIQTIMQELGFDSSNRNSGGSGSGTISTKAEDTERQTDIKALHGQLEAYYAQKGYYPTLADINSVSWRKANMKGLDDEALRDPAGTAKTLAAVANGTQYGYKPEGCVGSKECQTYILEAILSNKSKYTKTSLN